MAAVNFKMATPATVDGLFSIVHMSIERLVVIKSYSNMRQKACKGLQYFRYDDTINTILSAAVSLGSSGTSERTVASDVPAEQNARRLMLLLTLHCDQTYTYCVNEVYCSHNWKSNTIITKCESLDGWEIFTPSP